jgi:Flp pilus assembly protein TadG
MTHRRLTLRRLKPSLRTRRTDGEKGQALVLFVICLVMILTTLALVINGGVLRRSNQELWNALDSGALAGAASLPANPTAARTDAIKFARINHPGLASSAVNVSYRCLVGDRNGDLRPDPADIPAVCDPGSGVTWTCADGRCVAVCVPGGTRTCNTVVVEGTVPTAYRLDEVTGVDGAATTFSSAACSGLCGADPQVPLDIGIVIDRTTSMSASDLTNVKNATLATLRILDPTKQHVALAVLGKSQTSADCGGTGNPRGLAEPDITRGTWVTVPYPTNRSLSTNYQNNDGSLNTNSQLVRTINCLDHSHTQTNLGDPLTQLSDVLIARGRRGVPKGIIFMTDGAANQPNSRSCRYANDAATAVKNRGIELFTIGFGVAGDRCVDVDGTYQNALAATLLADMATGPTTNNGCTDAENSDGDHYFCEPRSDSLTSVFRAAASQLLAGAVRLVQLPA